MNSTKMERMNLVIRENFIKTNDYLIDVYLINGIKMTSYMAEVDAGKYLLLKDRASESSSSHMVFWSTVVTINRSGVDQEKIKKPDVNTESTSHNKINISCEVNKDHIFVNKVIFIYLANGIKLDGLCVAIDSGNYIVLEKNSNQQIILWHAIATMSLVTSDLDNLLAHSSEKNNRILGGFVGKKVAIFLKTGIKLQGILTDFSDLGTSDRDWELVLDNKQLIRAQHVSTITENKI